MDSSTSNSGTQDSCVQDDVSGVDTKRGAKRPLDDGDSPALVSKQLLQNKITYGQALQRFLLFDNLSDLYKLNAALCAINSLSPSNDTAVKLLDSLSSKESQVKGLLYRAKICMNLANDDRLDKKPKHFKDALENYNAMLANPATTKSDREKANASRDFVLYQLRSERMEFTADVRKQACLLPEPEKVNGSIMKWKTNGEIVDLETDTCTCRLQVACRHMCKVYGCEEGTSLKNRTKDQLVALMKLNNMCYSGRTCEELLQDLMEAKARGGAPPPCPLCGSHTDEESGQFRCRKNHDGRERKDIQGKIVGFRRCTFMSVLPRVPLRGL